MYEIMHRKRNIILFIGSLQILVCIFYVSFFEDIHKPETYVEEMYKYVSPLVYKREFLVNTTNCRIPDIDPFNAEIMKFVHKENYTNCTTLNLLSYIDKSNGTVTLNLNSSLIPYYSSYDISCCYSEIHRSIADDNRIIYSTCKSFNEKVKISYPFIKVVCRNTFYMSVYENVHAVTILTETQQNVASRNNSVFSVLMVGIDSISKQNLRRTMPKSYDYLEENYINLRGYNKIGENTFPNLMATLTGQNITQLEKTCTVGEKLDNCDFIWNDFRDSDFITAYAEDDIFLSTFNYIRSGFSHPPTDYYYRPYMIAAEKLSSVKTKCNRKFCAGPEASGERILNSAKDFSITFKNLPSFGLFWMNTFSHDNINCPSAMDDIIIQFLRDKSFISSLNNTIFIFFSDHGFRFGDIRYTNAGSLEDKLPFMYVHIPNRFKRLFPKKYNNFLVNSIRLTTPYDLHFTLQNLLQMADNRYRPNRLLGSYGCPNCHSLFEEVNEDRSCADASISRHWCTCKGHHFISPRHPVVQKIAVSVTNQINILIKLFPEGGKCATYSLENVHSAGISKQYFNANNQSVNDYLVIIKTKPLAMFEATAEVPLQSGGNELLLGDIIRISRYSDNVYCIDNHDLEKYCYCEGFVSSVKTKICEISDFCF